MRILLATPPLTQLNTPYPATAYLCGFLRQQGYCETTQEDPAIDLVLRLFSRAGITAIQHALPKQSASPAIHHFLEHAEHIQAVIESVIRFLQGKDSALAMRIATRAFLPEGPRFAQALNEFAKLDNHGDPLNWAFGSLGVQDRAKYLASLFIDDLADAVREGIDPRFQLSRYGEKLAASQPTFDPLHQALEAAPTLVDQLLDQITEEYLRKHKPQVLALTAPFPGNVYGAFRMARIAKRLNPEIKTLLGGGYANTELRELKDPRVFAYFDAVMLDDGEKPFLCWLEHLNGKRTREQLLRTFTLFQGRVAYTAGTDHDIPLKDAGTPTYQGLDLSKYLAILEMLNPMHRVWSDGRWNKLTLAHGCYWKKCNFCDVTLDYIGRYEPAHADLIVDRMEQLIRETGQTGFHFVDEAAPPALLKAVAQRLIEREVVVTWWGNIRFEKSFTPELCQLLATSGCIAVSGGLEVASPRLLEKMNKGVTVEQVARVTQALTQHGILVHAYLMYGFPTQTEAETVDALERVRQLFEAGCLQSAYWHRFSTTAHSPIGQNPEKFGIRILPEAPVTFARNDLGFEDPTGVDHERLGRGLNRALFNYMHGLGFETPAHKWFEGKAPKTTVSPLFIEKSLRRD